MPATAFIGRYPHPGIPGAWVSAGLEPARAALGEIFRNGPAPVVCDIETYGLGLDANRIKCVSISSATEAAILDPRAPADHAELGRALDYARTIIWHKGNYDGPSLAVNRLIRPQHVDKSVDSLIYARIAEPGERTPKDLDSLAQQHLGLVSGKIAHLFHALGYKSKREGFAKLDIDSPAYLMGAGGDGIITMRILPLVYAAAMDRLTSGHPFTLQGLDRAGAAALLEDVQECNRWAIDAQIAGIRVDFDWLERYRIKNAQSRSQGEFQLRALGIDPGNGNHLTSFLERTGSLPADHRRTKTGKLGAAEGDLAHLTHPIARVFTQVKELAKIDGYMAKAVDLADDNGRVHPSTDFLKAAHGRSSMSGLEIHQFPEDARGVLIADQGETFTSLDWSQQEPRIAMNLAGDITPLQAYEQSGTKIYRGIADYADVSDKQAKIVVLAGLYGQGKGLLSAQLGLPPDPWIETYVTSWGKTIDAHWGYAAARDVQDAVFSAIPETERYMREGKNIANDHQLAWTVAGRIIPIPSGYYKGRYSIQTHKWINFNVSGSAADEMMRVVAWARRNGYGSALKWNMHDELIVETVAAQDFRRVMETPSERFCQLSKRVPVIRTDMKYLGTRWDVA